MFKYRCTDTALAFLKFMPTMWINNRVYYKLIHEVDFIILFLKVELKVLV